MSRLIVKFFIVYRHRFTVQTFGLLDHHSGWRSHRYAGDEPNGQCVYGEAQPACWSQSAGPSQLHVEYNGLRPLQARRSVLPHRY